MDRKRKLLLYLYLKRKYRRKQFKRFWVRPTILLKERKKHSVFFNLNSDQRRKEIEIYKNYFRMLPNNFDHLVMKLRPVIEKHSNREPISPEERVAVTLRYLTAGDSMTTLAGIYRMGVNTVGYIIRETCTAIWTVLSKEVFPESFSEDFWENIANNFENKWNIPHCIGALDGKHIVIQAPPNSGSQYYNYKGQFSIILMALCDATYKFIYINLGSNGRQSDGGVFRKTDFYKSMKQGKINLPHPRELPGANIEVPYFIVADEAFPLTENIMRPYPGHFLDMEKRVFNYRLSRARRVVENAFGILASRWRILRSPITTSLETAEKITLACICLHNWLLENACNYVNEVVYSDILGNEKQNLGGHFQPITSGRCNVFSRNAADIRNELTDYFMTQGSVPWQWEK